MSRKLFAKKPLRAQHLPDESDEPHHELRRHLGMVQLTSIGIGAIIGAGIFVITGQAAALYAGPGIVFSFIIAALICMITGLCYAELSALIPASGGVYSYSYVALGEFPAWTVGWMLFVQVLGSAATVAVGWSGYFSSLLQDFGLFLPEALSRSPLIYRAGHGWELTGAVVNLPAVLLLLFLGFVVSVGVKSAARLNNIMVVIKLSVVLLFVALGFFYVQTANWTPFIPKNTGIFGEFGWSGILRGAGLVFFAYLGFDTVATLAQDAKNPQKDLPRGILSSLGISAVFYVIVALVLTGIVHYTLLDVPDPIAVALQAMGPSFLWVQFIVKLAILAGLASAVLAQLLAQTRIFFAISKDGLIPARFGKVHPKLQTPLFSTIMTTLICLLVSAFFPVNVIGELVVMAALILFSVVCLGVWILRITHPEFERPFKVPFVPVLPLLGILSCWGQICFFPSLTWIQMAVWVAVGLLVYFFYSRKRSKIA